MNKEVQIEEFAMNVTEAQKAVKKVAKTIFNLLDTLEDLGTEEVERFDTEAYETLKSLEKIAELIDYECLY